MSRILFVLLLGVAVCHAGYQLDLDIDHSNFFSFFDWSDLGQPINGDNHCDNQKNYWASSSSTWERDLTAPYSSTGPQIIRAAWDPNTNHALGPRMVSTFTRGRGLWVTKLYHLPTADFAWPAFWFLSGKPCDSGPSGNNWPYDAEIDWIESFHHAAGSTMYNKPVLHTGYTCNIPSVGWNPPNAYTLGTDCNYYTNGPNPPHNGEGCVVVNHENSDYTQINNNGGAYFALLWDSTGIKQYFWRFDQNNIPSDIESSSPNPANWGSGLQATFPFSSSTSSCSESTNFGKAKNLVIDIKICGNPLNDRGCTPPTQSTSYYNEYISMDFVRYYRPT